MNHDEPRLKGPAVNHVLIMITMSVLPWLSGCGKDTNAVATVAPADSVPARPGWTLVWNDEFSGPVIDTAKWQHEVNGYGGGNNELQYYTADSANSYIADGMLVIQALRQDYLGKQYTSARLNSRGKGDWTYGRIEARAKLPEGKGMWPAIWMMPTYSDYGGWPASGEIDIMECLGQQPNKVYGTIHFGSSVANHQQMGGNYTLPTGAFSESFHVFAVEWDPDTIRWYVDEIQYFTAAKGSPFDREFFCILNVAVGGNWPGSPDEFTVFPQRMLVDYVRVYRRS